MLSRVATVVACCLLVGVGGGVPATATPPADAGGAGAPPVTTPEGFDETVFEIQVYRNGSARWTLRHVRILDNRSQVLAFQEFADRFEERGVELGQNFQTRARRLTAFGSEATGRRMNATAFDRQAFVNRVGQTRGVVELSFLWTGFAPTEGDRVVVADVFEGGLYIADNQRIVFGPGPVLVFTGAQPAPDSISVQGNLTASDSLTWFGERRFADSRPRVAFVTPERASPGDGSADPVATAAPESGDVAGSGDGTGGPAMMLVIGIVVVLGLGVGGGIAWYAGAIGAPSGSDADAAAGGTTEQTAPAASGIDAEAGDGTRTEQERSAAGSEPVEPAIPDEQLLSDEDRVVQLLEQRGGRMKQVEIVEETEWSKSKVSMLLSDMAEAGQISKLRLGRENIISLAGEEPDAAGSPFDEE
ncbi:MAG: helix-turn-helix transcriptional regulator [Salinirussus sp.]